MVTTVTNLWWKGDGSVLDLVAIVSDLRRNEIGGQEIIRSVQQAEVDPNARQRFPRKYMPGQKLGGTAVSGRNLA